MFITDLDILDASHMGQYYDRTYDKQVISYYKLPYKSELEGLNVSIQLTPVTGSS